MGERLTAEDVRKIEEEIEHRKLVVRHEALADLKEARAQGDLSENFEYYAAKRFKNQNEGRIRYLENMIKHATIVEDTSNENEAGLNDTVTIYIPEDDEEETYKITTSIRGDSMSGRVSIESPLGKAILGCKVGDTATVVVNPSYSYDIEIRSISKSDDEGDDLKTF